MAELNTSPSTDRHALTTADPTVQLQRVGNRIFRVPRTVTYAIARELDAGEVEEEVFISPRCFGSIIGRKGLTKRSLQQKYNCSIIVPSSHPKDPGPYPPIRIIGSDPEQLCTAAEEIRGISNAFRTSQLCTHELIIPITGKDISYKDMNLNIPQSYTTALIIADIRLLDIQEMAAAQNCMRSLESELPKLVRRIQPSLEANVSNQCAFDFDHGIASIGESIIPALIAIVDYLQMNGLDIVPRFLGIASSEPIGVTQCNRVPFDKTEHLRDIFNFHSLALVMVRFSKFAIRSIKHKQTILAQISN